jgi:general secretion pathway protein C
MAPPVPMPQPVAAAPPPGVEPQTAPGVVAAPGNMQQQPGGGVALTTPEPALPNQEAPPPDPTMAQPQQGQQGQQGQNPPPPNQVQMPPPTRAVNSPVGEPNPTQ